MNTPAYSLPSGAPAQPRRSWFERNWKWFVPVMLVSAVLLFGLFFGALFELLTSVMRSSVAYQTAVQRAEESPEVADKIGHPIKVGWIVSGNINVSSNSGNADLSIPISGPRGKGRILVSAKKQFGKWTFQTLEVQVEGDDTPIPLLTPDISTTKPSRDFI
jgi:hypothetical protein